MRSEGSWVSSLYSSKDETLIESDHLMSDTSYSEGSWWLEAMFSTSGDEDRDGSVSSDQ